MNAAGTYYTSVATAVGSSEATNRTTSVRGGEASILIDAYEISSIASVGGQCYTQSGSAVTLNTAFTFAVSKDLHGDNLTRSVENVFRHSLGFANCFVNADIITPTETVARTTSVTSNTVLTSQTLPETTTSPEGITTSPTGVSTDNKTTSGTIQIRIAVSVAASVFTVIVNALVIFFVLKHRNRVRLSKQSSNAESKEESDQLPWLHRKPELDAEQQRHEMEAEKEPRELQGQSSRQEMEAEQEALELEGQSSRAEIGGDQANVSLRRTSDSQELRGVGPSRDGSEKVNGARPVGIDVIRQTKSIRHP